MSRSWPHQHRSVSTTSVTVAVVFLSLQDEDEEGEPAEKAAVPEEKEPPQETRIEVDVPKISTDLGKVR